MWTTSQFSRLTGVPKRTLQYWSQPCKGSPKSPKTSGKSVQANRGGGAGILSSYVEEENGYRSFSEDSLAEVLTIQMAKDSGYSQSEIQDMMQGLDRRLLSLTADHIDRLVSARREIDHRIRLAQAICLVWGGRSGIEVASLPGSAPVIDELRGLIAAEFSESLAQVTADFDIYSQRFQPQVQRAQSQSQRAQPKIPEGTGASIRAACGECGEADALAELARIWGLPETEPRFELAKRAIRQWSQQVARVIPGMSSGLFSQVIDGWLSGGYASILLELHMGEGFVEFVRDASAACASES